MNRWCLMSVSEGASFGAYFELLAQFAVFFVHAAVVVDHVVFIYLVVVYVGMNMDVVATTMDAVIMPIVSATFMIGPAPAVVTGGVSGDANATVAAAVANARLQRVPFSRAASYADQEDNVA